MILFIYQKKLLFFKEGIYKLVFIKDLQIVYSLPYSYIFHRNLKLIGNTYYNTAFSRAIKFGNRQSCNFSSFGEFFGLFKSILSCRTIEH